MADLSSLINLECEPNSGEAWLETATALIEQHVAAIAGCIDAYKQRIAEIEAKVPRWIPVEERLPEPMGPSVFALEAGSSWPIRCVYHEGTWYSVDNGSAYDVTHWMPPLPSPPAEPEKEGPSDAR